MGQSLSFLYINQWRTVEAPYILSDGEWKTVHKVHVLSGGAWKQSHKTAYSHYDIGTGGQVETAVDGSWTVPDNTRYIRVKIWGPGASGGGQGDTRYFAYPYNFSQNLNYYWRVTGASTNLGHSYPSGGGGGHGGYAEVVLETKPGVVFSWTGLNTAVPVGGTGARNMVIPAPQFHYSSNTRYTVGWRPHQGYYTYPGASTDNFRNDPGTVVQGTAASPGETKGTYGFFKVPDSTSDPVLSIGSIASPNGWAGDGYDAADIVFTGDSPTSGDPYIITAGGGKKGYGGRHIVTAASKSGNQHSYTIGDNNGSSWAHAKYLGTSTPYDDFDSDVGGYKRYGAATATGNGSSFEASTLTRGGGMAGGEGAVLSAPSYLYGEDGDPGLAGKLIIDTYQ